MTGPFTVESLSPHRVLVDGPEDEPRDVDGARRCDAGAASSTMILDNLRKAGVQNTGKGERLDFDRLDPYPGVYIQADGRRTDEDGEARRVPPSRSAPSSARSARAGQARPPRRRSRLGSTCCSSAASPSTRCVGGGEPQRSGELTDPPGPDEPRPGDGRRAAEEDRRRQPVHGLRRARHRRSRDGEDGKLTVEIRGLDVYDPTTGEVRSASTDDIACWFIDTDYDGESFFVRHAYFTGADDPYDKLKRALRAEIDEAAWATLYATTSRALRHARRPARSP